MIIISTTKMTPYCHIASGAFQFSDSYYIIARFVIILSFRWSTSLYLWIPSASTSLSLICDKFFNFAKFKVRFVWFIEWFLLYLKIKCLWKNLPKFRFSSHISYMVFKAEDPKFSIPFPVIPYIFVAVIWRLEGLEKILKWGDSFNTV